jgi:GTP-binding protein Era
MIDAAWRGVAEADRTLLVVDAARGFDAASRAIAGRLAAAGAAADLALNKVDAVRRTTLLALTGEIHEAARFGATFMVSAETGDGVADLKRHLAAAMPAGPWLFPADQLTDLSERLFAAEITREQVFRQLRQELPYAAAVETERWEERADGSARIDQTIFVERDGQKAIVLGAKGARLKAIGAAARAELGVVLGRRIHLFLHVKVLPAWAERRDFYAAWGLDFDAAREG